MLIAVSCKIVTGRDKSPCKSSWGGTGEPQDCFGGMESEKRRTGVSSGKTRKWKKRTEGELFTTEIYLEMDLFTSY